MARTLSGPPSVELLLRIKKVRKNERMNLREANIERDDAVAVRVERLHHLGDLRGCHGLTELKHQSLELYMSTIRYEWQTLFHEKRKEIMQTWTANP